MKAKIKDLWIYLIHQGIKPEYDIAKRTKIVLTNQFAIISLSFPFLFASSFYISMPNNLAWLYQSMYILFPIAIWLNNKHFHLLASLFLIVVSSSVEFLICSTFGYESGEHMNFISLFFAGYIITDVRKISQIFLILFFPIFCIVLLYITDFSLLKDNTIDPQLLQDNYLASFINTLILSGIMGYINYRIQNNQFKILEKTQLNLNEALTKDEKEKNRLIVENALDAVLAIDTESRILEWNKQAEHVFGWTKSEILGKNMIDYIIPPHHREAHKKGMNHFLNTGEVRVLNRRIEITGINKKGVEFPIELSIVRIKSGENTTFSAFIRDLSEKRKAEEELQMREEMIAKTNKMLSELKLNALKSQINPHFYFNTLNNLYGLALSNSDKTPEVILMLSGIMEYIIYDCNADEVALSKEIDFIKNYVEIEKLRYFENADITFEQNGNPNNLQIAPMILIQFVENAFKHGLQKMPNGGFLHLKIDIDKKKMIFSIDNSKVETEKSESSGGIGMQNALNRLYLLYFRRHEIKITNEKDIYKVELEMNF